MTLAEVFTLYGRHRTPRKSVGERRADARRVEMWTRYLGAGKDPYAITLAEWESFIDQRSSGMIDARGNLVPENKRKPVRDRNLKG